MTLALAAVASAGGFSVVQHGTRAAVDVIKRTTHTSSPRTLSSSPANAQYKKHCGISTTPKCHITIYDASVREGSTGTTTLMTFTLSLDATNDGPVTVQYKTTDNTAFGGAACGPGIDYISQTGTVVFPTGSPSQTITIVVCGDATVEPNETFYIDLFGPSPNADIYRARATGTIVNDD